MLLEKLVGIKWCFGVYRFLLLFFVIGVGIEFFMVKVCIGREIFCKLSLCGLCNIDWVYVSSLIEFSFFYVFF